MTEISPTKMLSLSSEREETISNNKSTEHNLSIDVPLASTCESTTTALTTTLPNPSPFISPFTPSVAMNIPLPRRISRGESSFALVDSPGQSTSLNGGNASMPREKSSSFSDFSEYEDVWEQSMSASFSQKQRLGIICSAPVDAKNNNTLYGTPEDMGGLFYNKGKDSTTKWNESTDGRMIYRNRCMPLKHHRINLYDGETIKMRVDNTAYIIFYEIMPNGTKPMNGKVDEHQIETSVEETTESLPNGVGNIPPPPKSIASLNAAGHVILTKNHFRTKDSSTKSLGRSLFRASTSACNGILQGAVNLVNHSYEGVSTGGILGLAKGLGYGMFDFGKHTVKGAVRGVEQVSNVVGELVGGIAPHYALRGTLYLTNYRVVWESQGEEHMDIPLGTIFSLENSASATNILVIKCKTLLNPYFAFDNEDLCTSFISAAFDYYSEGCYWFAIVHQKAYAAKEKENQMRMVQSADSLPSLSQQIDDKYLRSHSTDEAKAEDALPDMAKHPDWFSGQIEKPPVKLASDDSMPLDGIMYCHSSAFPVYNFQEDYQRIALLPSLADSIAKRRSPIYKSEAQKSIAENFILADNSKFQICPTYPPFFILPKGLSAKEIQEIASYRSSSRLPAVVYLHPTTYATIARCSQPCVGISGTMSLADVKLVQLLQSIAKPSLDTGNDRGSSKPPLYHFIDCRSSIAAAANAAQGKGTEDTRFYTNSTLHHCDIPNIHAVRSSYTYLGMVCRPGKDRSTEEWKNEVESTQWLTYIAIILVNALYCAQLLVKGEPLMIHCSDGWDRTPQLTSLVQLLLDPYYRTVLGFCILIEKEWCYFGHQFRYRYGHNEGLHVGMNSVTRREEEQSPVFIQWLDCIYQIWCIAPWAFEFNLNLLGFLYEQVYACLFGTFLSNSYQEKLYLASQQKNGRDIFHYIMNNKIAYINLLYNKSQNEELNGKLVVTNEDIKEKKLSLWEEHLLTANPVCRKYET